MDALDFLDDDLIGGAADSDSSDDDNARPSFADPGALRLHNQHVQQALTVGIARFQRYFNEETASSLEKNGFWVCDDVLSSALPLPLALAKTLASEILQLQQQQATVLNSTAFVSAHKAGEKPEIDRLLHKPGIYEAEITDHFLSGYNDLCANLATNSSSATTTVTQPSTGAPLSPIPAIQGLWRALPSLEKHLASLFPQYDLSIEQGRTSIKTQYSEGKGACFPFHYDSPGGSKDSRRLTLLLYLNEGWQEGDGGELALQPFLGQRVEIRPLLGRLVLFKSTEVLHRVLPSHATRRCLTIWFHCRQEAAEKAERDEEINIVEESASTQADKQEEFVALWLGRLQLPKWQRILSKYVYFTAWKQSFEEAHQKKKLAGDSKQADGESGDDKDDDVSVLVASLHRDVAHLSSSMEASGVLKLLSARAKEKQGMVLRL